MNYKLTLAALAIATSSLTAHAQTEIQWWHSMGGARATHARHRRRCLKL